MFFARLRSFLRSIVMSQPRIHALFPPLTERHDYPQAWITLIQGSEWPISSTFNLVKLEVYKASGGMQHEFVLVEFSNSTQKVWLAVDRTTAAPGGSLASSSISLNSTPSKHVSGEHTQAVDR